MKIGRNEPCPCGSGKKYKKCCLPSAGPSSPTPAPRGIDIDPYTIARLSEDPRSSWNDSRLRRLMERRLRTDWTIRRVADMSTEAIEEQLGRYGVRHTRERFLELAAGRWSAWSVAEVWLARDPVTCKGKDEDFVGLAACELWKRWLSDRPSLEMLNDWMQDGYDFMERGLGVEAVEKWWQVWRTLQPRFEPGMTTMDKTRPLYEGTQSLFNWSQDLSMELLNAALEDAEWARRGVQFHREWIAQFPDEDDRMQANFHRDLAECLIRSGDAAAGLTVFHEVVERWPDDVWGYVALADACSDGSLPVDLDQARKWIATARARLPAGTRDLYVLDVREAYIQERASRAAT